MEPSRIDQAFPDRPLQLWGMNENTYCMLLHLSQLLGFSGAGIAVPIIMWAVNKDKSETVDRHGKNVLNWLISELIYAIGCAVLCLVLIGIPLAVALVVIGIVFPIIGAVKANNGDEWKYPMSIAFLK